jgi:DNA-directed RNA polymerase subunit RPC12/RpoP
VNDERDKSRLDDALALIEHQASVDDPLIPDVRAVRACRRCGYKRIVLVRTSRRFVGDGTWRELHGIKSECGSWKNVGESYENLCTACKADDRAAHYRALANEWQRRGREIRERQEKNK